MIVFLKFRQKHKQKLNEKEGQSPTIILNPLPTAEAVGLAYRDWMKAAAFLTIIL